MNQKQVKAIRKTVKLALGLKAQKEQKVISLATRYKIQKHERFHKKYIIEDRKQTIWLDPQCYRALVKRAKKRCKTNKQYTLSNVLGVKVNAGR